MAFDIHFVEQHKYAIGGTILGLIVFYLIYSSLSGGSSSGGTSSGTSAQDLQLAQLQTAAGVQESQVQGQVQVAQTAADVQNNQTAAAVQATQLQTAAALQLGTIQANDQTATAITTAQIQSKTTLGVNAQNTQTTQNLAVINDNAQLQQDAIVSATAEDVTGIEGQTQVQIAQANQAYGLAVVGAQTNEFDILAKQGKLGGNSTGVAQVVSAVQGKPIAAPPTSTTAQNVSAVGGLAGSILGGLF